MRKFAFIILIVTSSLLACKNSSQAMDSNRIEPSNSEKNNTKDSPQEDVIYNLVISFISKGEGIDHELKRKIDAALASFNEKNKTDLKPEIVHWGREGEVDYLFLTKNLSTSQKKNLATQIKEAIGTSDMAQLQSDKKSVHKR